MSKLAAHVIGHAGVVGKVEEQRPHRSQARGGSEEGARLPGVEPVRVALQRLLFRKLGRGALDCSGGFQGYCLPD